MFLASATCAVKQKAYGADLDITSTISFSVTDWSNIVRSDKIFLTWLSAYIIPECSRSLSFVNSFINQA